MFLHSEPNQPSQESFDLVHTTADTLARDSFGTNPDIVGYMRHFERRVSFDLDQVCTYVEAGAKILEVGAFPYLLTIPLVRSGYRVTVLGKGSSQEHLRHIPESIGAQSIDCDLDVDAIAAADGCFDAVVMNEVFEHLRINLIFSMRELYRVLRPGGVLLLSTPNLRSINGIYNLLRHQESYSSMGGIFENFSHLEKVGIMGHIREYTPKEVTDFLLEIGFSIQGVIHRGRFDDSWWVWRASNHLCRIAPQFRPFFSVVACKPAGVLEPSLRPACGEKVLA